MNSGRAATKHRAGGGLFWAAVMTGALACTSTPAAMPGGGGDDNSDDGNGDGSDSTSDTSTAGPGGKTDGGKPGSTLDARVGGKTTDGGATKPTGNGGGDTGTTTTVTPSGDGGSATVEPDSTSSGKPYTDPGTGMFEKVAKEDVLSVCKLDPDKLAAAEKTANFPWVIIRYGNKLCWDHNGSTFTPTEAYSTTKTLGALVTGMVSYETRDIPKTGPKTGPFSDEDRVDQWLSSFSYNKEAKVAHVLGMVAHDTDLSFGKKSFAYDTVGATEINSISTMLNTAIGQDKTRLGANVEEFTKKFLYAKLGMTKSTWSGGSANKTFAYTWSTDLLDMARVGVLINNYGVWSGERLLSEEWVYRMTHPSFEDANTGFDYLTWLNSKSNWTSISGGKQQMASTPGTCAPVCIHKKYPHGVSEAKDCGYTAPATCDQKYDVGVWQAEGLGGQLIQGHRGLDMVIVARNAQPGGTGPGTAHDVWEPLKGAVIAGDPMYKGDEAAFCKAYGGNDYAPDMH